MKDIYIKNTVSLVGKEITLFGWVNNRRDHGKLIFIDFKDSTGLVQCVITPHMGDSYETAKTIKDEYVCKLKGLVKERPEKMQTESITGKIEIEVLDIEILNESILNPFDVYSDGKEINEELRLKKRYIDLKRPRLHNNLKQRFLISNFFRNYLQKENFIEIETPYLTKTTPEGARDFLVPSRISKGSFYGLPQSPQQYKQLLMISQLEKYFQLTRCFRDEDPRGDRQPEFTQLDMEISFFSQEQIMSLIENMLKELVQTYYPEKTITQFPFPRIDYETAIKEYNTDKPDLRKDKNNPNELAFAFVVNFPMFE
jgi:aspartyl-tRNA synthetase